MNLIRVAGSGTYLGVGYLDLITPRVKGHRALPYSLFLTSFTYFVRVSCWYWLRRISFTNCYMIPCTSWGCISTRHVHISFTHTHVVCKGVWFENKRPFVMGNERWEWLVFVLLLWSLARARWCLGHFEFVNQTAFIPQALVVVEYENLLMCTFFEKFLEMVYTQFSYGYELCFSVQCHICTYTTGSQASTPSYLDFYSLPLSSHDKKLSLHSHLFFS